MGRCEDYLARGDGDSVWGDDKSSAGETEGVWADKDEATLC